MAQISRYLIGIDLGTTNSVLAYFDTAVAAQNGSSGINVLDVPQLAAPGEVRTLTALPSFLYFPTQDEQESGTIRLPWDEHPQSIAGTMARDHGVLVPARQVMSAKSWLSHGGVDRRAKILPREAQPPLISPVEASAHYLAHLRDAWNLSFAKDGPDAAFEKQEIVLTVPASFDEEARELTVEAAREAGIENLILLEEPLAAFYAWTATHHATLRQELNDGDLVLICDVGGGTTDFSLVRAHVTDDQVEFERTAIGEHLLLGGDNLDLALARRVEAKLKPARLSMRQRHALQRACCAAKERLLSDSGAESFPITVLGGGRQVVGQMLVAELRRSEVVELLTDGFLPLAPADAAPKQVSSAGLRELGLPYASDPAITKHLATFLRQASAALMDARKTDARSGRGSGIARPDAVLFNGGFCVPAITRERIVDAIAKWFPAKHGWRPKVLHNEALGAAVAKGAAYYGRVRHGFGVRVRANSPRTYYIAVGPEQRMQGVCILPAGVEEGTTLPLVNREFMARANRPVSFTLYSSRTRRDAHGELADLEGEQVHHHAPLVTLLRYGKKMRDLELAVRLRATFTELGTLELWCESLTSPHRWRLQFELRSEQAQHEAEHETEHASPATQPGSAEIPDEKTQAAEQLVRGVFGQSQQNESAPDAPDTLTGRLEEVLGIKRDAWPMAVIRRLADLLIEFAEGRKKTPRHEWRWLNLMGLCLRPGFGAAGDEARVGQVRRFSLSGPAFPRELQCEVEWLVLLRRVCGGLNASQQHELYRKHVGSVRISGAKKSARINAQVEYDSWRLLASLEHLPSSVRVSLGSELVKRTRKDASDSRWLWPLARLGARIPLYGPLHCVVSPDLAADWIAVLLEEPEISPEVAFTIVQIGRRTDDPSRDVNDGVRKQAIRRFRADGVAEEHIQLLEKFVPPGRSDAVRMFGDSLPKDLHLVSSANCLLSLAALGPEPGRAA